MSRLKRKPEETLKEWVSRIGNKKKDYTLKDVDILLLTVIGAVVLFVLIIEIVWI
jgi:hypothetical protein